MSPRRPLTTEENYEVNNLLNNKLYFFALTPDFPNSVFLEWENKDRKKLEGKYPTYGFNIFRSQSPEGPYIKLNSNLITAPFYLDDEVEQFSIHRNFYYIVEAESTDLASVDKFQSAVTVLISDEKGLKRRRFLEYNKIRRDRKIQLSMVNAEAFVLKKKHMGTRCPDCWLPGSKVVTDSKCPTCFGTSYVDPYYTPVRILIEYSPEQKIKNVTDKGYSEVTAFSILMQNTPRMRKDDLVYEPNNDRMFKVIGVQQTLLNKVPLSQTLSVTELNRDSIVYQIPVDRDAAVDLYKRIDNEVWDA